MKMIACRFFLCIFLCNFIQAQENRYELTARLNRELQIISITITNNGVENWMIPCDSQELRLTFSSFRPADRRKFMSKYRWECILNGFSRPIPMVNFPKGGIRNISLFVKDMLSFDGNGFSSLTAIVASLSPGDRILCRFDTAFGSDPPVLEEILCEVSIE